MLKFMHQQLSQQNHDWIVLKVTFRIYYSYLDDLILDSKTQQ